MPNTVNQPELIISLSFDQVRVQLLEQPATGRERWHFTYPIHGMFLEEQISTALDAALLENPDLMEHFDRVEIIVMDRPNICVPEFYNQTGKLAMIARKYLRIRAGDFLASDTATNKTVIAYTLPTNALQTIQEYYATASHLHIASLLWSKLSQEESKFEEQRSRIYFILMEKTLMVLQGHQGNISFCKSFLIQTQEDLVYYTIACSRLLLSDENWYATLKSDNLVFDIPKIPFFAIHQMELPELSSLIAQHRLCES